MSMEKMMTSLINNDQENFNTAFDAELKTRISGKMPAFAKAVTTGMVSSEKGTPHSEPESSDTINTTDK
tara:strand:- start:3305 stop:3511 length:207 start_codon:yes stop_codon:yes gene_type:complete